MKFHQAQRELNARFHYRSDRMEAWQILKGAGQVFGDCEDYALTLIWLAEGRSMWRFWWALITFKYLIWQCKSPRGVGHAVLWVRGIGWTDNIKRRVLPNRAAMRAQGYRFRFPWLAPLVLVKFVLRWVFKLFRQ